MDVQTAAHLLWTHYRGTSWFAGVGVTDDASPRLLLYARDNPGPRISSLTEWEGFPLQVIVSGESIAFRTANHHRGQACLSMQF